MLQTGTIPHGLEGRRLMETWFHGPAAEFVKANQEGWRHGVSILHFLAFSRRQLD
jgi:hypothetical protein